MVSSDEINRRLEARRRGVKYPETQERRRFGTEPSNTKECPSCHTQNPPTAKFCVGCGEKLETQEPGSDREFSPDIKGTEESAPEKPIQKKHYVTQRPDDFNKSRKLEPIVPSEPEKFPEEKTPNPEHEVEPIPEPQKPPEIKKPDIIPTSKPKVESAPTPKPQVTEPEIAGTKRNPDVDPVERIKKAKELLDLGAITQEDFDKIKNKYLDEI